MTALRPRDERGSTSLLIIGFFLVTALLVGVVVDASAAYLRRQGLANVADGAALAAADGATAERAYAAASGPAVTVDVASARRYAEEYLRQVAARDRYPGLVVSVGISGGSVVVRLRAPLHLPIPPPGWGDSATVTGSAAAYVVIGD